MNLTHQSLTMLFDILEKNGLKPVLDENAERLENEIAKYIVTCMTNKEGKKHENNNSMRS